MNAVATNLARKPALWIAPMTCSAVFLGYLAVVFMNLPPVVRSDHVSVNWNMLFIAGIGAVTSAIALAAMIFLPITKHLGRVSASIICVEAASTLFLSAAILYRTLTFFGIV